MHQAALPESKSWYCCRVTEEQFLKKGQCYGQEKPQCPDSRCLKKAGFRNDMDADYNRKVGRQRKQGEHQRMILTGKEQS